MPKSNQGEANRDNGATSKQSTDQHRSPNSEKGKSGQTIQGAQGQKGKQDMSKEKMGNHGKNSDDKHSGSNDQE